MSTTKNNTDVDSPFFRLNLRKISNFGFPKKQKELANMLHCSQPYVSDLLRGRRKPSRMLIGYVALEYGFDFDQLANTEIDDDEIIAAIAKGRRFLFAESALRIIVNDEIVKINTLKELEEMVPRRHHQTLSQCIELLAIDDKAAQGSCDNLKDLVTVLLRDAKRQIEDEDRTAIHPSVVTRQHGEGIPPKKVEKPTLSTFIDGGLALPDADLEAAMVHFRRKLAESQNKRQAREAKKQAREKTKAQPPAKKGENEKSGTKGKAG